MMPIEYYTSGLTATRKGKNLELWAWTASHLRYWILILESYGFDIDVMEEDTLLVHNLNHRRFTEILRDKHVDWRNYNLFQPNKKGIDYLYNM